MRETLYFTGCPAVGPVMMVDVDSNAAREEDVIVLGLGYYPWAKSVSDDKGEYLQCEGIYTVVEIARGERW